MGLTEQGNEKRNVYSGDEHVAGAYPVVLYLWDLFRFWCARSLVVNEHFDISAVIFYN